MTTLDPSHLPWLAGNSDPATGGAVHTSVRAPLHSHGYKGRHDEAAGSSSILDSLRGNREGGKDYEPDEMDVFRAWKKQHRSRRRAEREQAREANRVPTLPLPDVRFEQSYLLSIQPFMRPTPSTSGVSSQQIAEQPPQPAKSTRDKRRRVEESLALVTDPAASQHAAELDGASPPGNPMDRLFSTTKGNAISIDWSSIAYITVRDQVFSPLVQGALWALGGIFYSSARAYFSYAKAPVPVGSYSSSTSSRTSPTPSFWDKLLTPLQTAKALLKPY